MAFQSSVDIVNAALLRIGEQEIVNLSDGSAPARIARANYETCVRSRLTRHEWKFAKKTVTLASQGAVTVGRWTYAFTYPAEALSISSLFTSGAVVDAWDVQGATILTCTPGPIEAEIMWRAPESAWPEDFAHAMITEMHAVFLDGLVEARQDARQRRVDAEREFRRAMARDKRQTSGALYPSRPSPLERAWRGAGRRPYL